MTYRAFRPTHGRVQNASKILNGTRTNATIRDLTEEEGEIEEKEGTVVSIKRDLINGAGWTVQDADGQSYTCSCATSLYELPQTVERGGILYPSESVTVKFTINPVLRVNTITEFTSLGEETDKLDISQWQHNDEPTTVIAKPRSAISISNSFITMNYDNNNQVIADGEGISTEGNKTDINTDKLNINSNSVKINGKSLDSMITQQSLLTSNEYESYNIDTLKDVNIFVDRTNNMTQLNIQAQKFGGYGVIGEIKDQKAIPIREQSQQLVTDGHCVDVVTIDTDGIIYIKSFENECPRENADDDEIYYRNIISSNNWITPQVEARNYIKTIVQKTCNYCGEGNNTFMEYINYCPYCKNWNVLIDTSTSLRCSTCGIEYCQNCGTNLIEPAQEKLKKYHENFISAYGTTCEHCNTQLKSGTNKQFVNYCPDCEEWGILYASELRQNDNVINTLECRNNKCRAQYCCSCGISQNSHGITLTTAPAQYNDYSNALRKLKYIKDGI